MFVNLMKYAASVKLLSPCFINAHLKTHLCWTISFIILYFSLVYQISSKTKAKQSPYFHVLNICHFLRWKFVELKKKKKKEEAFIVTHLWSQFPHPDTNDSFNSTGMPWLEWHLLLQVKQEQSILLVSCIHRAISRAGTCSTKGYSDLCKNIFLY